MRTFNAAPRASILVESMRDIGYSLETALADIIDNSITAGAENIEFIVPPTKDKARIGIIDDGRGMTEDELLNAMRPGSQNPLDGRSSSDLGRFGLGLKTASFSQCRKLTVVSRCDGNVCAAIWDLDYVARTDDWLVQIPDAPESIPWAEKLGRTGTLVIWENMDRVVGRDGDLAVRLDEVCRHLELVFHRFLSRERGVQSIKIKINNRPLEPFDPFNLSHPATMQGPEEIIRLNDHDIVLRAFTLPHHRNLNPREWEHYAGREGYLKNQGFYVYREKRLIIYGTWFGLARQAELTKLARVRIDMPNGLDSEWKIDVKKASAQLPPQVRDRLRQIIDTIGATSRRVYTERGRRLTADSRLPVWSRFLNGDEISYGINPEHPVLKEFTEQLPEELRNSFKRVVELLGSTLPMDAIFADLSNAPEQIGGSKITDDTLNHTLISAVRSLRERGVSDQDLFNILSMAEPFRTHQERTEGFLRQFMQEDSSSD